MEDVKEKGADMKSHRGQPCLALRKESLQSFVTQTSCELRSRDNGSLVLQDDSILCYGGPDGGGRVSGKEFSSPYVPVKASRSLVAFFFKVALMNFQHSFLIPIEFVTYFLNIISTLSVSENDNESASSESTARRDQR